jgi:hypothetical protein
MVLLPADLLQIMSNFPLLLFLLPSNHSNHSDFFPSSILLSSIHSYRTEVQLGSRLSYRLIESNHDWWINLKHPFHLRKSSLNQNWFGSAGHWLAHLNFYPFLKWEIYPIRINNVLGHDEDVPKLALCWACCHSVR